MSKKVEINGLEALELLDEQEIQLQKSMTAGAILRYKISKSNPELFKTIKQELQDKEKLINKLQKEVDSYEESERIDYEFDRDEE